MGPSLARGGARRARSAPHAAGDRCRAEGAGGDPGTSEAGYGELAAAPAELLLPSPTSRGMAGRDPLGAFAGTPRSSGCAGLQALCNREYHGKRIRNRLPFFSSLVT